MHDAYRVDKGGKPTFDRVMRGLDVLRRHGVDWNVLTTVHAVNGDHGRAVYTFLRDDLGATFIQYIPIIERATEQTLPIADAGWGGGVRGRPLYTQDGTLVTHRSIGPGQYGRFLIDVFEEWVRHDIGTVYVQMFDSTLASFYGEPGGMCVHAETCGEQLALEHTGDLYSCDHYVEPGYLLGNIADRTMLELVASPQQRKFGQDKHDTLTRYCLDCDVRFACQGGCPKDRFATSPYGELGQHYLCPGYQDFFHHVPCIVGAKQSLHVVGVQDAEGFFQQLHHLDPQNIYVAERQPFQVVAQVQPSAADDGDRPEARVIGTLPDHVGDPFVTPEQRHLMHEMAEQAVEVGVRTAADWNRRGAIIEQAPVGREAVALCIAQHLTPIELVQCERALTAGEPHRAGPE